MLIFSHLNGCHDNVLVLSPSAAQVDWLLMEAPALIMFSGLPLMHGTTVTHRLMDLGNMDKKSGSIDLETMDKVLWLQNYSFLLQNVQNNFSIQHKSHTGHLLPPISPLNRGFAVMYEMMA